MPDPSDVPPLVEEQRLPPFCYQTRAALDVIRGEFSGTKRATALAVYVALTDLAARRHYNGGRNGYTAGRRELAAAAGVGIDTLDRYVKSLERIGLLNVLRAKVGESNLPNRWALVEPSPAGGSRSPGPPLAAGDGHKELEVNLEGEANASHTAVPGVPPPHQENRPGKVDGKPVTDEEYDLASEVLSAFNRIAGTRYSRAEVIGKIVMRIREQPKLNLAAHEEVIRAVLRRPWWKGDPGPQVVYGNAELFERNLHAAVNASEAPALTFEEMEQYGITWGPGTPYETPAAARAARAAAVEAEYRELPDA